MHASSFSPWSLFNDSEIKHIFVTWFSLTYCYFKRGFHFVSGVDLINSLFSFFYWLLYFLSHPCCRYPKIHVLRELTFTFSVTQTIPSAAHSCASQNGLSCRTAREQAFCSHSSILLPALRSALSPASWLFLRSSVAIRENSYASEKVQTRIKTNILIRVAINFQGVFFFVFSAP